MACNRKAACHVVFQGQGGIPPFVLIRPEIVRHVAFRGQCSIPPFVLIRPAIVRPAGSEVQAGLLPWCAQVVMVLSPQGLRAVCKAFTPVWQHHSIIFHAALCRKNECSAAAVTIFGGRRTRGVTAVSSAVGGRQTLTFTAQRLCI